MKKATEGITLIALIITILVLLILTGVTIATLTGENGIINKATAVQAEMTIAEEKEAISLSYAAAIMETLGQDVTADDLRVQLRTNGYDASKVTVTEEGENAKVVFAKSGNSYTVTQKGVITGPLTGSVPVPPVDEPEEGPEDKPDNRESLPSTASTKPYYPGEEFEKLEGTNLDNGLVVTDGINYWTWVEVPRTTETYNTATLSLRPDSKGLYTEKECTMIEEDLIEYAETVLSGIDESGSSSNGNIAKNGYTDEWYEGCGIASEDEYNALKRKMLSSVYTNGGFWIGQYEMGASTYVFSADNAARTPVCQKGAYVYNLVTASEAQTLATNINSGDRTSSLLFGLQWDLVMKHLQNKGVPKRLLRADSTTWGNYQDSEFTIDNGKYAYYDVNNDWGGYKDYTESVENIEYYTLIDYYDYRKYTKTANKTLLLTTGASETNSKMNIYDLAGNVSERTLEKKGIIRGGHFSMSYGSSDSEPIAYHRSANYSITHQYDNVGFRPALY